MARRTGRHEERTRNAESGRSEHLPGRSGRTAASRKAHTKEGDGGGASSLLWRTIGEPPTFHGTLNVAASSPFGNAATTFEYSGLLQAEETPFRPSIGTPIRLDETFLLLDFDVVFELSIDTILGGAGLGPLDETVLPLVNDFLSNQKLRYYGSLVALEANEPPPVSVSEPHTLALLIAGLVLAGRARRPVSATVDRRRSNCPRCP